MANTLGKCCNIKGKFKAMIHQICHNFLLSNITLYGSKSPSTYYELLPDGRYRVRIIHVYDSIGKPENDSGKMGSVMLKFDAEPKDVKLWLISQGFNK